MFMNLVTTTPLNFGSGRPVRISRLGRRDIEGFRLLLLASCGSAPAILETLGAVLRTALAALVDAGGIERATDRVVADGGKVLHTPAADHHDGVLLEVVAFAADVAGHLEAV